jgi:hypothetical protein
VSLLGCWTLLAAAEVAMIMGLGTLVVWRVARTE